MFLYYLIKMLKQWGSVELYLYISEYMFINLPKLDQHILDGTTLHVMRYHFPEKTILHVLKNRLTKMIYNFHVSQLSRGLDIFVANTLGGGRLNVLSYPFLRPQCNYVLVESLYGSTYLRALSFFSWDKVLNYFAYKICQWQIDRADKLLYHSREVIEKVKSHTNKPLMFMPFNFFEERCITKKGGDNDKIILTVSGGIEKERRDFTHFFPALEILLKNNPGIREKISIVLLGTIKKKNNAFGISIVEKAKEFNCNFGRIIKYYEDLFIPEEEYRRRVEATDILMNPINLEKYKLAMFTCGLSEAITYSIPGIYPEGYKVMKELDSSSLFFRDSQTLADLIKKIVIEPDFLPQLKGNAVTNSRKVMLDDYSVKLYNFIVDP